jgi:hypothetical protein
MSVVTQLYFQIVEENNYMFRPFSVWAIIRLRLEYLRKLIYCNVDIKNGGTRSRFTMSGEVRSSSPRVDEPTEDATNKVVTIADSTPHIYTATHLPKHCKTKSRSPILDVHIVVYEFSLIF